MINTALLWQDSSEGLPHHHDRDDQYESIIRLLKEARRQDRRDYERQRVQSGSSQLPFIQLPSSSGSNSGSSGGSNGGGGSSNPPHPILRPTNNGGNFGTVGSTISGITNGGGSSNFPQLPNFPGGSLVTPPPYPIEQVNRGVNTILNGVRSFDLAQILRGAFVFPRNENVRSVANNVIDTIFGAARPAGGARI